MDLNCASVNFDSLVDSVVIDMVWGGGMTKLARLCSWLKLRHSLSLSLVFPLVYTMATTTATTPTQKDVTTTTTSNSAGTGEEVVASIPNLKLAQLAFNLTQPTATNHTTDNQQSIRDQLLQGIEQDGEQYTDRGPVTPLDLFTHSFTLNAFPLDLGAN